VRLAENEYYLVSAGAWTAYDADFLMKSAQDFMGIRGGWVDIHDVTTQWGVFAIAGPKSRDVLAEIVKDADPDTVLGNKRFPWLSMREIELGMCPVRAIRVAYTGELGWELHHPIEMQNLPVGSADGRRGKARDEAGRRAGAELAAAGEELPRLRDGAGPGRDAAGGGARPVRGPRQGVPRQGEDGRDRRPVQMRDGPDRRAGGCRSLGARGPVRAIRRSGV
jgi:hypothetical protein